jgi:hypothetical protein
LERAERGGAATVDNGNPAHADEQHDHVTARATWPRRRWTCWRPAPPPTAAWDPLASSGSWPVEVTLSTDVELTVDGYNGDHFGLAIRMTCAALPPGGETSQQLHRNRHEQVNGVDQRAAR